MEADVIVVGAGLGGLSTAAFLTRYGARTMVLEKSKTVGGCCTSGEIESFVFDVGSNYFGRSLLHAFRDLGLPRPFDAVPIRARAMIDRYAVTHPFGAHSLKEFQAMGMDGGSIMSLGARLYGQLYLDIYGRARSSEQVITRVAGSPLLSQFFNVEALLLGSSPDIMPSYLFNVIFGPFYGFDRPFYPRGGSQAIPQAFVRVIEAGGGRVYTGVEVESIVVREGAVSGVMADGSVLRASRVVSTLGVAGTVQRLNGGATPALSEAARRVRRGLGFATCFLVLSNEGLEPPPHTIVGAGQDLSECLRLLLSGDSCPQVPFVLTCPDPEAAGWKASETRPAILRFPLPCGSDPDDAAMHASVRAAIRRVDTFLPGFSDRVTWWKFYSPSQFKAVFGFDSCYSPELETREHDRHPNQTDVAGLFLAGASVGALGVHTGSAVESGRRCARSVLAEMKRG